MGCASSVEAGSPRQSAKDLKPTAIYPGPIKEIDINQVIEDASVRRALPVQPTPRISPSHVAASQVPHIHKERRAAAGSEAVRDQIRKLAVGGTAKKDDDGVTPGIYEVSDSESDDEDNGMAFGSGGWSKPQEVTDAVCEALQKNFVFKGISDSLLQDVVERMYGVCFKPGSVVLQQGALPQPDDCMYYLKHGEAEVVISGAVDQSSKSNPGEERTVEGHTVRISQKPGWMFGDVALLFHSSRTASVIAKTNITVWALERKTFLKFVMRHAQGARALRFLRKLPLLKGLADNDLIRAAARMPQRVYQDNEALIKYGERGNELFLIRYGKVKVMRPDGNGGQVVAVTLGRGQFIGERAVINNRMRSADCIAEGTVQVVVMEKRDFMNLDNPLLAWMLDYDAVATCLRGVPYLKSLKQEHMENILDRFDPREEKFQGDVVINQGELVEKIYVIKIGEVRIYQDNRPVSDPTFLHEVGGFSFFGESALERPFKSPYQIVVHTDTIQLLTLPKRQLDNFLGLDTGLNSVDAIHTALKKSKALSGISLDEVKALLQVAGQSSFQSEEVIYHQGTSDPNQVILIISGEAATGPKDFALPGQIDDDSPPPGGRKKLAPGGMFNEDVLLRDVVSTTPKTLIACKPGTTVILFTLEQVSKITSGRLLSKSQNNLVEFELQNSAIKNLDFKDFELHRVIGTGQFGMVRLVRNITDNQVYALKSMFKAPITESKQIEHVINERRILGLAQHPFCVRLKGAYQDKRNLHLLQEWIPGGELFFHLDLEGSFDEPTSKFFAANVLVALEFLHAKGIVYRDLKPENLLVDTDGYLKVADFGFAKYLGEEKTFTICGTPDYQAPEVIMRRGTNKAADYWGLGVLIFEMLVGDPPFKSLTGDPWDTFRRTLSGRFFVPNFISDDAADLIFKLLQVNPEKRLGSGPTGAQEIKDHKWFASIDWEALERKELRAPMKPKIRNALDTSNFDNFDDCIVDPPPIPNDHPDKHAQWNELWSWVDK